MAKTDLVWPFDVQQGLTAETRAEMEHIANQANDAYVHTFIEGHSLCPYAKDARRRGETHRYVHVQDSTSLDAVIDLFLRVADDPNHVVTQLIFPALECQAEPWIEFCHRITRVGHRRRGGHEVLANAALHPHLPYREVNAYSLIPLFRRTPDPTLQWVRLDALERLYEGRSKGSTFVDPAEILSLMDRPPVQSLYDRVAEANQRTAISFGIKNLEARLAEVHLEAKNNYLRLFGGDMALAIASPQLG